MGVGRQAARGQHRRRRPPQRHRRGPLPGDRRGGGAQLLRRTPPPVRDDHARALLRPGRDRLARDPRGHQPRPAAPHRAPGSAPDVRPGASASSPRSTDDGDRRIREVASTTRHVDYVSPEQLAALIEQYRQTLRADIGLLLAQFSVVDVALRVVGVGSVGTRCYVVLLLGPAGEPLVLQVKEAPPSVLETYGRWPSRLDLLPAVDARPAGVPGRVRAAHPAGELRPVPRVDRRLEPGGHRRPGRLLRAPVPRHEGLGGDRGADRAGVRRLRLAVRAACSPGATARARRRPRWPATSGGRPGSRRPSPRGRWRTPIRPSATTRPSRPPCGPDAWPPSEAPDRTHHPAVSNRTAVVSTFARHSEVWCPLGGAGRAQGRCEHQLRGSPPGSPRPSTAC